MVYTYTTEYRITGNSNVFVNATNYIAKYLGYAVDKLSTANELINMEYGYIKMYLQSISMQDHLNFYKALTNLGAKVDFYMISDDGKGVLEYNYSKEPYYIACSLADDFVSLNYALQLLTKIVNDYASLGYYCPCKLTTDNLLIIAKFIDTVHGQLQDEYFYFGRVIHLDDYALTDMLLNIKGA